MKAKYFNKSADEKLFFLALKEKVNDKLKDKTVSHGGARFWFKGLFWTLICYSSYSLLFLNIDKTIFWLLYVVFQLSGLLIGFSFGHDASHDTAFRNKKANSVLHFFSFLTVGIDPLLWGLRHIRSHHLYANVEGSDIDIDKNPFLRLSPTHPWKPKHKYQAYYAPFVYMFTLLHSVFMSDWVYLFSDEYNWMKRGVSKAELYFRFLLYKVFYFSLVLVLPLLYADLSWTFIVLTFLTASAFTSMVFIIMLVGTHFFDGADYPQPEGEFLEHTWAVHQLYTSCDWDANKGWARFLSGGSNCHAAHHLFPNICHTNYSEINEIIEETTKEYKQPYHHKTLFEMMFSHFKHLHKMGKPEFYN
ncbi:fatty acid desaturase family protein [Flavobacterium chungangense]|uniref:Acyl-CoA desaturase n=1 Tax=Flavobacterium chungangense TaxID=554283 RepID=A0A6V6YWH1_9FLAO|nr:fatty acid desaturase [Flavobacterium chungangense]CAD0003639.1 acyl-CoA desaturase [Flavobacterium chungangense]